MGVKSNNFWLLTVLWKASLIRFQFWFLQNVTPEAFATFSVVSTKNGNPYELTKGIEVYEKEFS
ncbi:hypothetical protein DOX53_07915 [Cronobacter malonaticus]|uniref:Uncharacterized protein n=1 Tax=Cronobacter malonaticus TaxID=413503 RepID=A0ABX5JYI4_9ENTR|nr:hypothetical protein [Cronobacter malonaticus]CCJ94634.1 hypothetical protein BN131_2307 [Cronobacter malonaticus 681]EGT4289582.1 hypothetical protein [Cronobacter malonaticus]EGT4296443.1 hypothetical protein [Cronobacter malonaticus]EGT4314530.1 hypothetical protein [Cronobacter malonaticus]